MGYKRSSLMRRVLKRMQTVGFEDYGDYQYYDVRAAPLQDNGGGMLGVSVTFTDVTQCQGCRNNLCAPTRN
jgi:hypothetical protein